MRALPSFFPSVIRGATRDAVRGYALGAALLHLATVAHHAYRGVSIRHDFGPSSASGTWDWFWQNLVIADLRDRALQSLWHLHAQPPLWNALNAPLIKLFGESHPGARFVLHALMGAAMAAGVLVALDPALVLYEAYALYDLLCAFLVMVAFWAMVRAGPDGRTAPLVSALVAVTALVLTRSVYHVALLVPVVIGAAGRWCSPRAWRSRSCRPGGTRRTWSITASPGGVAGTGWESGGPRCSASRRRRQPGCSAPERSIRW